MNGGRTPRLTKEETVEGSLVQVAAQQLHEAIVADLKAGLSYNQIAFKHRVTSTTVAKHARKVGLAKGRKGHPPKASAEGRTA